MLISNGVKLVNDDLGLNQLIKTNEYFCEENVVDFWGDRYMFFFPNLFVFEDNEKLLRGLNVISSHFYCKDQFLNANDILIKRLSKVVNYNFTDEDRFCFYQISLQNEINKDEVKIGAFVQR